MSTRLEVVAVVRHVLYREEEVEVVDGEEQIPAEALVIKGVETTFCFHPERLADKESEIADLIRRFVPDVFRRDGDDPGGGFSFMSLCRHRDGSLWTDLQEDCESLLCLAIAAGRGGYCTGREMWSAFPGGMPFVWFTIERLQ